MAGRAHSNVIDYRVDNAMTRDRANFVDFIHYRPSLADKMAEGIVASIRFGNAASLGLRSTESHCSLSAAKRSCSSLRSANAVLVRVKAGRQFAMMAALESRELRRRGTIMGTGITRAIWHAKKATMNSRPGGKIRMARSPGWTIAVKLAASDRAAS